MPNSNHPLRRASLAIGALLVVTGVHAGQLPHYDVDAQCKRIASMGGNGSAVLHGSCMDMEQIAYDKLKAAWTTIPEGVQRQCNQLASMAGPGSYSLLESCIDMETQAAAKPRKFQY